MEQCNHCWHDNGTLLTSNPPQVPQTCCHCGERRSITLGYIDNTVHGKYKPQTYTMAQPYTKTY